MSIQSSLDRYFKSKSGPTPIITSMSDKKNTKKRRSLSLVKPATPKKSPKISTKTVTKSDQEVVDLCSDDELSQSKSSSNISQSSVHSEASNSSQSTIVYELTPRTPQKSPKASSSSISSQNSREKYFSPSKKRAVLKRSPIKKNLANQYFGALEVEKSVEDENFNKACAGMDDKSVFLLTIINRCLKDDSLKVLLGIASAELLGRCLLLIKPGIKPICRLYWRQHGWYKREQLFQITNDKETAKIGDSQFQEMINCLVENELLTSSDTDDMTFDDFTTILKGDEIKQICKELKLKIQSKQDAVDALRGFSRKFSISNFYTGGSSDNSRRVIDMLRKKAGSCYKLTDLTITSLYKLYLLMFLGMNYEAIREKKLELMLINDKISRETYPVDKNTLIDNASLVFRSSEEFDKYFCAHLIYENFLAETDSSEKCNITLNVYKLYNETDTVDMMRYRSLPVWLRRYSPTYLYVKILESGIQDLKKQKSEQNYQLALDILSALISQTDFRQHKKAHWYAEKALILHKLLARHDEAAAVLLEGLQSDLPEEAKDAMRPRANLIANQRNITLSPGLSEALKEHGGKELILEKTFPSDHVTKQHMETSKNRGKRKFVIHTENGKQYVDAEHYCIYHYRTIGDFTHGEHWEGRIVTTLFTLLFWDIIYKTPPGIVGVFLSRFQLYPLDMHTECFYRNRKTAIDGRLKDVENMDTNALIAAIKEKWDERPEHEISGVTRSVGWDKVRAVASLLGARGAAAVCRRLAAHYGHAHAGFPDLTLWDERTGQIKFVEVKTDTDKPSMKQLQWMRYLQENGIKTGFCYVGVSTERIKARAKKSPAEKTDVLKVKSVANINQAAEML